MIHTRRFSLGWKLCSAIVAGTSLSLFAGWANAAEDGPIAGIGPKGEVTKLFGDFKFTEGPAWDGQGQLYFSDIPAERIYKVDAAGKLAVFLEHSGPTNGLMFDKQGRLFAADMSGRIIRIDTATKQVTPIAEKYQDQRFNACNDLVVDAHGGIYFTDPRFRAPEPWPQGKEAVYYLSADGTVTRLADNLAAPNGVILSPDEQTLYVIPSMQKDMMAYKVEGPGKLSAGRVFCTLQQLPGSSGAGSGGDGLTVDSKGNLYITSALGLQVFNPDGKLLGIIKFPEQPANAAFGGKDMKTIYVTARTSLYAVEMEATGHAFPGKAP